MANILPSYWPMLFHQDNTKIHTYVAATKECSDYKLSPHPHSINDQEKRLCFSQKFKNLLSQPRIELVNKIFRYFSAKSES